MLLKRLPAGVLIVAAKVLALTALELMTTPSLIVEARKEFESRRGATFKYEPLVGRGSRRSTIASEWHCRIAPPRHRCRG